MLHLWFLCTTSKTMILCATGPMFPLNLDTVYIVLYSQSPYLPYSRLWKLSIQVLKLISIYCLHLFHEQTKQIIEDIPFPFFILQVHRCGWHQPLLEYFWCSRLYGCTYLSKTTTQMMSSTRGGRRYSVRWL